MIKYTSQNQLALFKTPFDQQLDADNRWVKLSNNLPWDELIKIYMKKLRSDFGAPGIILSRVSTRSLSRAGHGGAF